MSFREILAVAGTVALLGIGCGDSEGDEPSHAKNDHGGSAGVGGAGSGGANSGAGGISAGRGGTAGTAPSGGTSSTGGSAGEGGMGGDDSGGSGGSQQGGSSQGGMGPGGSGSDGPKTSGEVAASCLTPLMGPLLPDNTFGWNTAALRIDVTAPSCALQSGQGVGSGNTALYFAHESNDTYSLWSDAPWSFTLDSGMSPNDLPEGEELSVYPFLEDVHLRVTFSLSGETVTISAVEARQ
jgi:hypothetical protein